MEIYESTSIRNTARAQRVLEELDLVAFWQNNNCRANIVGSLAMGLLVKHLDIDLHVYSHDLNEELSFAIVSRLAKNRRIKEIRCINGLYTDEKCIAWHLQYEDEGGEIWQIDIIHIEEDSRYDGVFELMAQRIKNRITDEQRRTILRLKYETPDSETIHGVEYYQAVMESDVKTLGELRKWVAENRKPEGIYWMPQ